MWEEVARDILKYLHRPNAVYRILDRNGRETATVAVPMQANLVSASDVSSAIDRCGYGHNALINMRDTRLEFELSATLTTAPSAKSSTRSHKIHLDDALLSGEDLENVRNAAQTMIGASTTGVVPRIEIEFDSSSACIVYACNKSCVFDHAELCKHLDDSLLAYSFSNSEIMYRVNLSESRAGKKRKTKST